ncbi:hypothetical protein B0H14DRAFT_2790520, partial [Mycena olivaceomarginata]
RGKNTRALLALSAVCGSLSKPYQPHPTSTAAIGAANKRHRPGEAPPAFLPYGACTRAELCHVVRRIIKSAVSVALSYHGGRWGASPRVGDWPRSTIMEPAGGVGRRYGQQ